MAQDFLKRQDIAPVHYEMAGIGMPADMGKLSLG